jgi:biopolymer transport protein ExbD
MSLRLADPQQEDAVVAEINVTPLTDIFLVLLIIFMVTSTALTQQGAPVNLPRAGEGASVPASGVVVTVDARRQLAVDGKAVDLPGLEAALQAAFEKTGGHNVILQGDRTVVLEDAVHIMTIAKRAGAEKLAIATEPERSGAER